MAGKPDSGIPFSSDKALHIVSEAAAMAMNDYRRTPRSAFRTKTSFRDLVTRTDQKLEKFLVSRLGKLTPGCEWVLEEADLKDPIRTRGWIIDPLDGTVNFVHRFPVFGISVAWIDRNVLRWGAVAHPCAGGIYWARKGSGAFLRTSGQDRRLKVSKVGRLSESVIEVGFADVRSGVRKNTLPMLNHIIMNCHGVRRLGAAALDLCFVAQGVIDGFYEKGLNPWDVAAGGLIVREAGGLVSDFGNGDDWLYGRSILASNGRVHGPLLRVVRRTGKSSPQRFSLRKFHEGIFSIARWGRAMR
ncbi:inositol monophosphatase [bacterium]|nr:inositol monophosphatase [bacterium]